MRSSPNRIFNPILQRVGMWLSLVERFAWDEEVPGSNPGIPTIIIKKDTKRYPFFYKKKGPPLKSPKINTVIIPD